MEELDDSLNEAEALENENGLVETAAEAVPPLTEVPAGGTSDGNSSAGSHMEEEEDDEEDVNYAAEQIPYLIYQSVTLDVDMVGEAVAGSTTLWIGYQKSLTDSNLSATLTLHCRHFCNVSSVKVNNLNCTYKHCDPLKSLSYSNFAESKAKSNFTGEEADVLYRAALEVTRVGELTIQLPDLAELLTSASSPPILSPPNASRDVVKRLAKIQSIYNALRGADGEVRLIQVRIAYLCDNKSRGLSFRRPYSFTDSASIHRLSLDGASCLHSVCGLSGGSLRDVDGVRAWLPTIDSPDQRAVFDVSVTLLSEPKYRVLCSGRFVSKVENALKTTYRFFTVTRIPAMNLGFFIGKVESYSMPLYKIQGTILVATEIQDFVGYSRHDSARTAEEPDDELTDGDSDEDAHVAKKGRFVNSAGETTTQISSATSAIADTSNDGEDTKLYSDVVRHTTLGLDLGIRAMHKMTNKKYDHGKYSQIFVPGLTSSCGIGCESVSFDGFSLIDASLLHHPHQPYKEAPAHFQQLSAYLYSWLKTGIPIDSYNSEYAVHGTVGYLMNLYSEHLYGEEEGIYRIQKAMDTIVELYKSGRGCNIVNFFPESYESFSPTYRLLLRSKSTVLMHIIEHRMQDKEKMKRALSAIIKSPSLYSTPLQQHLPGVSQQQQQLVPPTPRSDGMASEPSTPFHTSMEPPTPYRIPEPSTPYRYDTGDSDPSLGVRMRSRANSIDVVAGIGQALQQNSLSLLTPLHQAAGTSMLPPTLQRSDAPVDYAQINDNDMLSLTNDCLSTESFCGILRQCAGALAVDLNESFIDKFLFDCSILLMRATVHTGEDKKDLRVVVEPVCADEYGGTEASRLTEEVRLRIVERIDDYTSDALVSISDRPETYSKLLYTRPQKKIWRRPKPSAPAGQEDALNIRLRQAESERLAMEKEQRKRALTLARDFEHPARMVLLDPLYFILCEVHLTGPSSLLVEQLYASIDNRDVLRHVHAVRCLARTGAQPAASDQVDRTTRVQLRALYDCVMGLQQRISTTSAIPKGVLSRPHCMYTRAEAAAALAQWQNERAPRSTRSSAYLLSILHTSDTSYAPAPERPWQGLGWLVEALKKMFMEVVRDNKRGIDILVPVSIEVSNESASYLRNAMLVSLSSVRAQNGFTPSIVIMILLLFCEHYNTRPCQVTVTESMVAWRSASRQGNSLLPLDDSHYKAVLLMCLSKLVVDPEATDLSLEDSEGSAADHAAVIEEYGGLRCLNRILEIASNFQRTDEAVARSTARINYSDLLCSSMDNYCDRYLMPTLCSNGLITTAALACLSEVDCQLLSLQARSRSLVSSLRSLGDDKSIDTLFTVCVAALPADRGSTQYAPTGLGELSGVDFVYYFLPHDAPPLLFASQLPLRKSTQRAGTSLCPPSVRQAALECFVRQCFLLHSIYFDKLKVKRTSEPSSKETECLLFVPAAIEAICQVLSLDSCSSTRQSAGMLLYDLLQSRPSFRSSWAAVCLSEPWYCYSFSDPFATTLPSGCMHSAAVMGLRKSQSSVIKNYLKGTAESKSLCRSLKRLWQIMLSRPDIDQCLRSLLITTWLYAFPRQAPRCLAALDPCYASEELDYATLFDDSLPSDRLIIKDSFESAQRVENYYRFGPNFKVSSQLAVNLSRSSTSGASSSHEEGPSLMRSPSEGPINSGLKISLSLSAKKSSVNLLDAVSAAGAAPQPAPLKRNPSFKLVFK